MPAPARLPLALGAAAARGLLLARVALCFAYFGVGVWWLGVAAPPYAWVLARLGRPEDAVTRRAQRAANSLFRSFLFVMTRVMRVGRVEWVGDEALLRGPALVVANHPSLIDTPLLGAKLAQADFIVGPEWLRNAWMRRAIAAAGYLRAEDGAAVVRQAAERLRAGRSVVVYPEGSRTPPEGMQRFHRGAAHIALESGCDMLPVTIRVTPRVLMRDQSWRRYPARSPVWRIEVGEPIRAPARLPGESRALAARRLTGVLEEHFAKGWERGRS